MTGRIGLTNGEWVPLLVVLIIVGFLPLYLGTSGISLDGFVSLPNERGLSPGPDPVSDPKLAVVSPPVLTGDLWWDARCNSPGDFGEAEVVNPLSDGGYALFGTGTGGGSRQFRMVRVDATGQLLVDTEYGGNEIEALWDAVEVSTGGFVMVGQTFSFGGGMYDIWVVCVDENGNQMWNRTFGTSAHEYGRSIIEVSTGGFPILGQTEPRFPDPDTNPMLIRLDEVGWTVWTRYYQPTDDSEVYDLIECSDGGFAFVGEIGYPAADGWLVRTDSLGLYLWNRTYSTVGYDWLTGVIEQDTGDFVLSGVTSGMGTGSADVWVVWTDADGNLSSGRAYGGPTRETCQQMIELADGGFALTGEYYYPGPGGVKSTLFMRIDASGQLLLNRQYGAGSLDQGDGVAEVSHGGVAICGVALNSTLKYEFSLRVVAEVKWLEKPRGVSLDIMDSLNYGLSADSAAGVDHWVINNTSRFAVSSAGVITNSVPLKVGVFPIEVTAEDDLGNSISAEFSIEVYDDSPPQWVQEPTNQVVELGDEFVYDLNATDPSGPLEWSVDNDTPFTIDGGGIVRSVGVLSIGPHSVPVSVRDVYGNAASTIIVVTVRDTTAPIWTTAPANQFVPVGEPVQYQLTATDLSGVAGWRVNDTIHFVISHAGMLTSEGILDAGSYHLQITAEDSYGNEAIASLTVYVLESLGHTSNTTSTLAPVDWGMSLAVGGIGFGAGIIIVSVVYIVLRSRRKGE